MIGFTLLALVLVQASCTTSGNPAITNDLVLSKIEAGTSTKGDVMGILGPPSSQIEVMAGEKRLAVWTYRYVQHRPSPWLYALAINVFVLPVRGGSETELAGLAVFFNDQGVVENIGKTQARVTHGKLITP